MRFSVTDLRLSLSERGKITDPKISTWVLLKQFRADVFGKEVQSAATYSYMWLADQVGHVFIGLLLDFILSFTFSYFIPKLGSEIVGLSLTFLIVSIWEFLAYRADMRRVTYPSLLDKSLLRKNAIIGLHPVQLTPA